MARRQANATREQVAERGEAEVVLSKDSRLEAFHDSQTHLTVTSTPQTVPAASIGEDCWRTEHVEIRLPAAPVKES